jgi:SH3-like domain-containing protein
MRKALFFAVLLMALLFFSRHSFALCIKASIANLRSGPGTNHEKTWQVFKYMPLRKMTKKGNWYKVKDVDGDVHWVFGKLVTEKITCAAVKVEKANIRSGPGKKFRTIDISPGIKYDSFKVLKTKGSWVKVEDEFGDVGWVFRQLLWIQ